MIDAAGRWPVDGDETRAANRAWWDGEADDYYAEHGAFLGDSDFVWGPEGWTEAELDLLGVRDGMTVLEIGAGAAQCSRWLARHRDVRVVASDLSMGMLRTARRIGGTASVLPLLQCDGLALPAALDLGGNERILEERGDSHHHHGDHLRRLLLGVLHIAVYTPGEVEPDDAGPEVLVGTARDQAHRRALVLLLPAAGCLRAAHLFPIVSVDVSATHHATPQ